MGTITDFIMNQLNGNMVSNISGKLSTDENTTKDAVSMALPLLIKGLTNNASDENKAQDLFNAVQKDHDGSILQNLSSFITGGQSSSGSGILGHIFGSKQDTVTEQLSQNSGLDVNATGNLLATLAPIVMGFLGKTQKEKNLDSNGLANLLANDNQETQNNSGYNLGNLFQLLDADKDGNTLNDVVDTGKRLIKKVLNKKPGMKAVKKPPVKKAPQSKSKTTKSKVTPSKSKTTKSKVTPSKLKTTKSKVTPKKKK